MRKPYEFLKKIKLSLNKNGSIILTLAIDIPQFDHLYNFNDLEYFRKQISKMNLEISYEKFLPHKNLINSLKSSNILMELCQC